MNLLTERQLEDIAKSSNVVQYKNHDVIFLQNTRTSHIMFIKSGLVKIYKEGRNGKVLILRIDTPNNFLGLMSVFGHDIHQFSAAAIDNAEIYFIDINVFRNLINENGLFAQKLMNVLSAEGLFLFDRFMSQSHKQLPGRIADVLLYFSEKIYHSNSFYFPLTRRELAELAGTTKESFIRTLTEFKNDKIIDLEGARVEIMSMKIIKTLSELG
ncbi:MAG: Crp/Fnr family transcriptional regulator [Bacteroidota bacterium]|nr:Crp/Fnr family transcriptional regulator [Bacteroidota bacterium]